MLSQTVSVQQDIMLSDEIISYISLFGALNREQLDTLLSYMHVRECRSGERIFSKGDLPSDIYILLNGRVDFLMDDGDVTRIQSSYKKGDVFGETAVIGIQTQLGTTVASGDDVQILVLSREALINIQKDNIELYGILMMNIAREVSRKFHSSVNA